jgi:hypothetical protein
MTALSKFLVLLAIFLLAGNANAVLSLSQVAGNQVQVNPLIQFEGINKQNCESAHEMTNDQMTDQTSSGINISYTFEAVNGINTSYTFEEVQLTSYTFEVDHIKNRVNN